MHRLNGLEYRATVEDTLGVSAPLMPNLRGGELNGFDNNGAVLGMDEGSFGLFYDSARAIARATFADAKLKAPVVTCSSADEACALQVLQGAGLKLFRRPLRDDERAVYQKLYAKLRAQPLEHDEALEQVLVALLSSAQFLYRMEFSSKPQAEPLDPYELASRLSYLLWSSAPDDELLEAARLDQMTSDEDLERHLARLWDDPRSSRFVESFAGQWFRARNLAVHATSPDVYPNWTPEIALAATREVLESFDAVMRDNRDFSDFYVGRPHDIDGLLAPFYGLPAAPAGTRVRLEGERVGFLGSVAFLTTNSLDRRSSPLLRGRFVLNTLVCEPLPPPPPDVPPLSVPDPAQTLRGRYDSIRRDPNCSMCHALMDPIGLALESYDGIGQYRTAYPDGEPIDTEMTLAPWPGHPAGMPVTGLPGIVERVTSDPGHRTCAAQQLYYYAIGGMFGAVDEQNIAALTRDWESGPLSFKALARKLVLSTTFRSKLARTVTP